MSEIAGWNEWSPEQYLADYYSEIQPDELETIKFLVERFAQITGSPKMVEVGTGPTMHHIFPAVPHVSSVVMSDYLPGNLATVEKWLKGMDGRHNWYPFVEYTLQCEGLLEASKTAVLERKRLTRQKVRGTMLVDVSKANPLGVENRGEWPLVLSCYCADSATDNQAVWESYMRNIASLVTPGGILITAALRKTSNYRVGERHFPSANIDEADLARVLRLDFNHRSIMIDVRDVAGHEDQGYSGIILAQATKKYETHP